MNSILERLTQVPARRQGAGSGAQTDSPKPDNREIELQDSSSPRCVRTRSPVLPTVSGPIMDCPPVYREPTKFSLVPVLASALPRANRRFELARSPIRLDTTRVASDRRRALELRDSGSKVAGCQDSSGASNPPTRNSNLERSRLAQARLQGASSGAPTDSPKPDNGEVPTPHYSSDGTPLVIRRSADSAKSTSSS